jgi:hypothetical protein
MKSGLHRILLPITVDQNFENSARFAFSLADASGAKTTVLSVDDDSPKYETTSLPFHSKNLNSTELHTETSAIPANNEQLKLVHSLSKENKKDFEVKIVGGHAATQILLMSRYHDVVILSDQSIFADKEGTGSRRVNPLLEILDQAVVPTVLCGLSAKPELGAAAIYFDGGPYATMALHHVAYLYQSSPEEKIVVRVSNAEESTARQLAEDASDYLKAKGLKQVSIECSTQPPIEYARSHSKDDVGLAVLGIRSRQAFHDFRIGALAHHFLEEEPNKNKLFC